MGRGWRCLAGEGLGLDRPKPVARPPVPKSVTRTHRVQPALCVGLLVCRSQKHRTLGVYGRGRGHVGLEPVPQPEPQPSLHCVEPALCAGPLVQSS